jgi:CBS domain-containing protein
MSVPEFTHGIGREISILSSRLSKVLDRKKLLTAPPGTSVGKAAQMMKRSSVGAVLVVDDRRLVGIFTERDAVFRVIAARRDPEATTVAEVMTPQPFTAEPDDTLGYALQVMHEKGFRHIPVVEDGVPIGIVSARSALDPDLEEFRPEAERRKAITRKA